MLTKYEHEIAVVLIDALLDYGLSGNLEEYGKHGAKSWYLDEGLEYCGFGMGAGCTKACIWHDDLAGWVIKVGLSNNKNYDYAKMEYENYCLAKEAGLAHYFPETVFIGEFGGRAFYAQRMCECDENQISSEWFECLCDQYLDRGEEYDCDTVWSEVDDLEDNERVSLFFDDEDLTDFLREHRINDLHEGNFGYFDGCKVIVDFSGFRGW